jgi:copper chaperone NosL
LATAVWFLEWYKSRSRQKSGAQKLSLAAIFVFLISMLFSCNTKPEPFNVGKDACSFCKMNITDTRFGGEVITKKGKVYKFDDLHCLVTFLNSTEVEEDDIASMLTINFEKPNSFLNVKHASYVVGPEIKSPMGSQTAGFESYDKAASFSTTGNVEVMDWEPLRKKLMHK